MSIVHGGLPSPFVRKVCVVLEEKEIPYRMKPLMPFPKSDELLALNPLGKIPIYEDERGTLPDSSLIAAYLDRVHPKRPLLPSDPAEFARALWLEEFADTRVAETAGGVFYERVLSPHVFGRPTDEARVANLLDEALPAVFAYLEECLAGRAFAAGDSISIADIALGSQLVNLRAAGSDIEPARFPGLAAYLDGILGRDSFRKLAAEEQQAID